LGDDILDKSTKFLEILSKYFAPIFVMSGVILFIPDNWILHLGLDTFKKQFHLYIGLTFLITLSFILITLCSFIYKKIKSEIEELRKVSEIKKYLKELTPKEKEILESYIKKNTQTQNLDYKNGVTSGLVRKGILYRASNIGTIYCHFDYNIYPWIFKYLKKISKTTDNK